MLFSSPSSSWRNLNGNKSRSPSLLTISSLPSIFGNIGRESRSQDAKTGKAVSRKRERKNSKVPFIVEKMEQSSPTDFREISKMCIEVFFNEDTITEDGIVASRSITKDWQLGILRNKQYSDLRMRTILKTAPNSAMFVARRAVPESSSTQKQKLSVIEDTSIIVNSQYLPSSTLGYYAAGEVIGFCEISSRRLGLPNSETKAGNDTSTIAVIDDEVGAVDGGVGNNNKDVEVIPYRPFLTNLAVKEYARRSGVGSKLLEACEDTIVSSWEKQYDLLLQVEDDNPRAIQFYEKRGYKVMFEDPATRRFDTSGFFLREVPSTKVCMRKSLVKRRAKSAERSGNTLVKGINNIMKSVMEGMTNNNQK